ncbi:MAG: hypothetical protein COB46_13565 [Rhodospirillaceae bacterium]|nr:MAG: hypothetical protein COB46_13565 [Rhodospirillaceae bacterium]
MWHDQRKVHKVCEMIACNNKGDVFLLLPDDFTALSSRLMPELEAPGSISFNMAVHANLRVGQDNKTQREWESMFADRLFNEIRIKKFSPIYEFKGEDARKYVEDFIECFSYMFLTTNFSSGFIHDGTDEVINISLHDKQSLLDKIMMRKGKVHGEINILRSDIKKLSGFAHSFELHTSTLSYNFSEGAVNNI